MSTDKDRVAHTVVMLKLLLISAALVYELVSPAEVDTAMNIIRQQSHHLVSVASTHEDVPILSICSQLCVSMTAGDSTCLAFSYDHSNKVCKISTEPSVMTSNDTDSATSMTYDITGVAKQSTDCREKFAQPVDNVTFHECATLYSSHPKADGEMSYNAHQKSCIPVLPQLPGSLSCTSGQETWLRYTDFNTTQIYGVPAQISITGAISSSPAYNGHTVSGKAFDGLYGPWNVHFMTVPNVQNPFLSGDIGSTHTISGAIFSGRSDCCNGNNVNLHFLVALDESDLDVPERSLCSVYPGPPEYPPLQNYEKLWLPCPLKQARFFKIMIMSNAALLVVGELEIFGY